MRILAVLAVFGFAWSPASGQPKRREPKAPAPPHFSAPLKNPGGNWPHQARELDRLERMSPQQRQHMLQSLPPGRARKLRERFDGYEQLTPEQRAHLRQQYDQFRQLPPARQDAIRGIFDRFHGLPEDRQTVVREEFGALQSLRGDSRRERFGSPAFRSRFNPDEQKLIEEMSDTVPQ